MQTTFKQVLSSIDKDTAAAGQYSSAQPVAGANKISFVLQRASHSAGNSVLTVEGSMDGTNFVNLNTLIDNAVNSNAETVARVASKQVTTNGFYALALDMTYFAFQYIRAKVAVTTDGTSNLWMAVESE